MTQPHPSAAMDAAERRLNPTLMRVGGFLSRLGTVALYLAAIGLVAMTVIVFWQVFLRYVLNWSNSWTEVTAVLIMSWFIFLGAAVGIRENSHLGFDVLLYVLPKGSKKVLRTISDVVVLAFAVGMVVYGLDLVMLSWRARLPALGIPEGMKYLPLVAGGAIMILFSLERMVLRFAGADVDRDVHNEAVPELEDVKEV